MAEKSCVSMRACTICTDVSNQGGALVLHLKKKKTKVTILLLKHSFKNQPLRRKKSFKEGRRGPQLFILDAGRTPGLPQG